MADKVYTKVFKIYLLMALLCLSMQQHGKTYEDLAEKIKGANTPHIIDANEEHDPTSSLQTKQVQTSTNHTVTMPAYSQQEIPNSKKTMSAQTQSQTQQTTTQKQNAKTEDYDNVNSVTHAKFHSHGSKQDNADKERAKQIAFESSKKKKSVNPMKLNTSYEKEKSSNERLHFLLTMLLMIGSIVIIVSVCAGASFVFYKLFKGNRERYFQFDENEGGIEMQHHKSQLSKIEEQVDEENGTAEDHNQKGIFASKRASDTTQAKSPTASFGGKSKNNIDQQNDIVKGENDFPYQ